jgi:hypothetical protein
MAEIGPVFLYNVDALFSNVWFWMQSLSGNLHTYNVLTRLVRFPRHRVPKWEWNPLVCPTLQQPALSPF